MWNLNWLEIQFKIQRLKLHEYYINFIKQSTLLTLNTYTSNIKTYINNNDSQETLFKFSIHKQFSHKPVHSSEIILITSTNPFTKRFLFPTTITIVRPVEPALATTLLRATFSFRKDVPGNFHSGHYIFVAFPELVCGAIKTLIYVV